MVEAKKDADTTVKAANETARLAAVKEEAKAEASADVETKAADTEAKETKAPGKKAETAKKAPAKKQTAAAAKKEAVKKETIKKEPAKSEAAKKTPSKTAAVKKPAAKKAEMKASVHFQFDGRDLVAKDVLDQAVKAFKSTHKGVEVKTMELYIVANEGAAYYVVNGEPGDNNKIDL